MAIADPPIAESKPAAEGKTDDTSDGRPPDDGTPWLVPWRDYRGDLWTRSTLTGDWFGARQDMMDKGLRFDISLTQFLQRNWAGGRENRSRYQGGLNLTFQLDTGKAGLWPGGLLRVKGEGRYGRSSNSDTGALMPVNFNSLYPVSGEDTLQLAEFNFTQFLAPWLGVTFGKFSPRETNVFSGDETTQFLNTAFNINPAYVTTLPQAFLGAGVILVPHKDVMLTTLVLDSEGRADECGFSTIFDGGTSLYQQLAVKIRPFGLPGNQRVGWTWSDKSRVQMDQNIPPVDYAQLRGAFNLFQRLPPRLQAMARRYARTQLSGVLATLPERLGRQTNDWSFFYDFDQYIYKVPDTKDQGIGIFGRFGITDGEVNPIEQFYSIGVGGKGMIPTRDNDTFGIGYYYLRLSDKLKGMFDQVPERFRPEIEDEQGIELYYNIAITPWLTITPDLQIINPFRGSTDCTWVAGLRMKIDF